MNRLKELRIEKCYTQKELSALSGVHSVKIAKIECGQISIENISLITAIKLANALGVHAEELI